MTAPIDMKRLLPAWERFREISEISRIRDEAHYLRMTALIHALLDEAAGRESHPAMGLIDLLGNLIEDYEADRHPLAPATGLQALKFLMDQHGLRQVDLPEIGSQGVVSEVLAGKRDLNIRQVRALAKRFGVSTSTFV
jgi:HTH-type transcriptional regulator/antitoxin HigA